MKTISIVGESNAVLLERLYRAVELVIHEITVERLIESGALDSQPGDYLAVLGAPIRNLKAAPLPSS